MRDDIEKRALDFVRKLNSEGWVVNEHLAKKFVIFAQAECVRAVIKVKSEIIKVIPKIDYKELL